MQLIEYADKLFVPDEDWNRKEFQSLLDSCGDFNALINDVYSYEKEIAQNKNNDRIINMVYLICSTEKCGVKKSKEIMKQRIELKEKEIMSTIDRLKLDKNLSIDTLIFLDRLNYFMGGNIPVAKSIERYYDF